MGFTELDTMLQNLAANTLNTKLGKKPLQTISYKSSKYFCIILNNPCVNAQLKATFVFMTFTVLPPSSCHFQNAKQIAITEHLGDSYFKTTHLETDQSFPFRKQHLFCLLEHTHKN